MEKNHYHSISHHIHSENGRLHRDCSFCDQWRCGFCQNIRIWSRLGVIPQWGFVPPLHYIIVDQQGNKAVIEYVKGKLNVYDTPIGTITNSPTYDWHLTNLRNYIGLSVLNRPSIEINGKEFAAFGQGSGAIGLPGDFTPPSRFVRATFLNHVALTEKDGPGEIARAFTILNQFDIPRGAIVEKKEGKDQYDETQWTSASDLAQRRYYFRTHTNPNIRLVDFSDLNLDAKEAKSISIEQKETFVNVSKDFS